MNKKHVAVLMGGMSSEHEVSMASGAKVLESLDREKYRITPVIISKDGLWRFSEEPLRDIFDAIPCLKRLHVDCAFIALHGAFGEDGRLQGMLDLLEIPYTSSGCAASALAIDKIRSKALVREAGIRVAGHVVVDRATWQSQSNTILGRVVDEIRFPCVVKSPLQGSSVGMAIPSNADAFHSGMEVVFEYGDVAMIEQFVTGTEVTCAVLDVEKDRAPRALPVTEIRPVSSSYFDYHAKYTPGASLEITPAEIAPELAVQVQDMAVRAHALIGCSIWSRSDMIIDAKGPVWIEVNTVPGLTPTSLFPQAAAAAGISYAQMLDLFVEAAMAKAKRVS